jgi:hypothetical protein
MQPRRRERRVAEKSIARQLSEADFKRMGSDFRELIDLVRKSKGELEIMFRGDYFNLYYQGNSVAKVAFHKSGAYRVEVHGKFLDGTLVELFPDGSGDYRHVTLEADQLLTVFGPKNLKSLKAMVRKVGYGAEITFEQLLMAHNPPSPKFLSSTARYRSQGAVRVWTCWLCCESARADTSSWS